MSNNNHLTAFLKISLITTVLFGGLLAQSYATNLLSDTFMKSSIASETEVKDSAVLEAASVSVQNNQHSDFTFTGQHVEIKTSLLTQNDINAVDEPKFMAGVNIKKLGASGEFDIIGKPGTLILRHKWAELQFDTSNQDESVQFKFNIANPIFNETKQAVSG